MFAESDLDSMLDELGTDALSGTAPLRGVYRAPNANLTVFGTDLNSDAPTFLVKQSTMLSLGLDIDSPLTVAGFGGFTISDLKAENTGFTRLSLTRD